MKKNYEEKFPNIIKETLWNKVSNSEKDFIKQKAFIYYLSHQDVKKISEISIDLEMWGNDPISSIWPEDHMFEKSNKIYQNKIFPLILNSWENLKNAPTNYISSDLLKNISDKNCKEIIKQNSDQKILGKCPVASDKTRCCNLLTLDAIQGCILNCSYCSVQSFYKSNQVTLDQSLKQKLDNLNLRPDEVYHIGTGQSSDSLALENSNDVLKDLVDFAKKNQNVILELKSKSNKIEYLKSQSIPPNIISTWTLNPNIIIKNEEHNTANLEQRIDAASYIYSQNRLIGFHFHPMFYFSNWEDDYKKIVNTLLSTFNPEKVAMISFGTLTYAKPVIKNIRSKKLASKVLQMPLDEISGKYSYPFETKLKMFKTIYDYFAPWHRSVFFYMCMEDIFLWAPIFGKQYATNEEFELDMKKNYMNKIKSL